MDPGNRKAVVAALGANLIIAIAKFAGFVVTGAASLLAEGVHSLADSTNQGLLLWGGAAAKRPETPQHPFGHSRERYFWAFVVALVIFSLGGLFAVYEGVEKLSHPHELEYAGVAIGILVVGIFVEGYSLRTAIVQAQAVRAGRSWWRFIRDTKSSELPVVLLEDLGAMVGLVVALLGVTIALVTGDARYDAIGSVTIGVLLVVIAFVLAAEMKSLLIGEAADESESDTIRRELLAGPECRAVFDLRTQHMGPDDLLICARLELSPALDFDGVARVLDDAAERVHVAVPNATHVYLEPDSEAQQADDA